MDNHRNSHPYDALTPDLVIDAVESAGYLSDARLRADRVCVAIEIPERLHDPIAYEAVVLRDSALATEAGSLLEWLASPAGRAALTRHGFLPPPPSAR